MRTLSLRLALFVGLVCLAAPAASQAASVGINIPGGAAAVNNVGLAASTGASTARVFLIYPGGSTPDSGTVANYQAIVSGLNASGVKPIIDVTGQGAPPADVNAYANYVGTLARSYGSGVAAWEIWNEPDEAAWWGNAGGNPSLYAQLLKATYPQVHPYAPVFVGGLTGNNYGFLDQVYQALGGSSAGAFDGVATHTDTACSVVGPDSFFRDPNGRIDRYSFLGLREVHQTMAQYGDTNKPIWITELGWSTAGGICQSGMWAGQKPAGVSEADQAKYLLMAWHCLKDYPYVTNALWFNLEDDGDPYGLLRADGTPRPSLAAFSQVVHGDDPYAGQPCGDFAPPTLTVAAPTAGATWYKTLPVSVSASDPSGVSRITMYADGQKVRNWTWKPAITDPTQLPKAMFAGTASAPCTTACGAYNWFGTVNNVKLPLGTHTLSFVALDGQGNQTAPVNVQVSKVAAPAKHKAEKHKKAKKHTKKSHKKHR